MAPGFSTRSDTNQTVKPQKVARGLGRDKSYYICTENKGANQLIYPFVFRYAKNMFSYDVAHLSFRIPNFCQIIIKYREKYVSGAFAFSELPFGFHKNHGLNTYFIMFPFKI